MTKNITYRVASQIEGYDLENFHSFRSAHDTCYYELNSKEDKINHILMIAENLFDSIIGDKTATRIYNYLEKEHKDNSYHYYALEALKYRDFNN